MFKIGQKVHIIEWVDMPQEMCDTWGKNKCSIGNTGIIRKVNVDEEIEAIYNINTYFVVFNNDSKNWLFAFEPEIEPAIRVGEQLLFNFIKEQI